MRQSNADRSHSAIDFCHFVLQAKDDAKDDSKDERLPCCLTRGFALELKKSGDKSHGR